MMRSVKVLLLGGAVLAAAGGAAQADELAALKQQIAALDTRLAAMEAAPQVPQGFRLLSISQGELAEVPGAPLSARERAAYAGRATIIGVLPTADAPAGASISWSGYVWSGAVYNTVRPDVTAKGYRITDSGRVRDPAKDITYQKDVNDWDVSVRAQLRVVAKTDTSVGEVGVELKLRADANGNGPGNLYGKVAWGYWAMTPELTLGGGYNQSLGDIVYGYDGSCTCYITDNADVDFDPGDTTQMRLSYVSGPLTMAVAVEDSTVNNDPYTGNSPASNQVSKGLLGVSGEILYTSGAFSGEIAGVWRDQNKQETGASSLWQVGVGGSVELGDIGTLNIGAALGQGPYQVEAQGTVVNEYAYDNKWWGVSALASIKLGDKTHTEIAGGYKHRDGGKGSFSDDDVAYHVDDVTYDTYAVMGGLYYTPVDQLTLGLEGEWYTTSTEIDAASDSVAYKVNADKDTAYADVVAVWSF